MNDGLVEVLRCLGCPYYDPDFGCLSDFNWSCRCSGSRSDSDPEVQP